MRNQLSLLIIVLILFTAGCVSIEKDWDFATSSGNSSAYRAFLQKHPDSKYSADAQARIAALGKEDWERIKNSDRVDDYRNFIWRHPDSEFTVEANAKIVTMARDAWKKTLLENKSYAYRSFLQTYPDCEFSPKALSNLEQLKAHKAVIVAEVPEILSPGDHYSIVFKETNGVGVVFKERQYFLVCDTGVYKRPGTGIVESDWIKVPPNGEGRHKSYVPWNWDNCSEVRNAWFGGHDDNGNYIEVRYSY